METSHPGRHYHYAIDQGSPAWACCGRPIVQTTNEVYYRIFVKFVQDPPSMIRVQACVSIPVPNTTPPAEDEQPGQLLGPHVRAEATAVPAATIRSPCAYTHPDTWYQLESCETMEVCSCTDGSGIKRLRSRFGDDPNVA